MNAILCGAGRGFCAGLVGLACMLAGGCAMSYATPGRGADLRALAAAKEQTDASVGQVLDKQPLARFPTAIAIVRIQEPGYRSATADSFGTGAYSVVTTRDIEHTDQQLDKLAKLPMVSGLAPINRLLLPQQLNSELELRQAAAAMHCDIVLVYTLDTTFTVQDAFAPLTVVTLGLSPNEMAHVVCTASAVLMDTRNGYVYGVAEATERQSQLASAWTSEAAVDQTRRRTEAAAFDKLVDQLQTTWGSVAREHATQSVSALQPR